MLFYRFSVDFGYLQPTICKDSAKYQHGKAFSINFYNKRKNNPGSYAGTGTIKTFNFRKFS